jgi:hypothetical protein
MISAIGGIGVCTQNQWISGLCPSSGILNTRKHNISALDLFLPLGEGRDTQTLLGPLERANLNHWTQILGVSLPSHEDGNSSSCEEEVL